MFDSDRDIRILEQQKPPSYQSIAQSIQPTFFRALSTTPYAPIPHTRDRFNEVTENTPYLRR